MAGYNPDFKQPPWVYGPKETMDWIEATHPSKKRKKKNEEKSSENLLGDIHIQLDLDSKQTKIKSANIFSKITGDILVEEDFNLRSISEIFLRALAKAKFRHNVGILIDKKIDHKPPEITSDFKEALDIFEGLSIDINQCKIIEITAVLEDVHRCIAEIKIKKVHKKKEHAIDILMKGLIKEELYHEFLNYLKEKLKVKNIFK